MCEDLWPCWTPFMTFNGLVFVIMSLTTSTFSDYIATSNLLFNILAPKNMSCLFPHTLFNCSIIINKNFQIIIGCRWCLDILSLLPTSLFYMAHSCTISTSNATIFYPMRKTTFTTFGFKISNSWTHYNNNMIHGIAYMAL